VCLGRLDYFPLITDAPLGVDYIAEAVYALLVLTTLLKPFTPCQQPSLVA
jgi:hypothetical protein